MAVEVDHVVVCVTDLDEAAREYERRHGVVSVEGGRHRGHGTANRIIPLSPGSMQDIGANYIELLSVVDAREARGSSLGAWVMERSQIPGADALCLRTADLASICARLGLEQVEMSRSTSGGESLTWRLAGLEQALTSNLPFFIQWDIPDRLHPGRIPVEHPRNAVMLMAAVEVHGGSDYVSRLQTWAPLDEKVERPPLLDYVVEASGQRSISVQLVPLDEGLAG